MERLGGQKKKKASRMTSTASFLLGVRSVQHIHSSGASKVLHGARTLCCARSRIDIKVNSALVRPVSPRLADAVSMSPRTISYELAHQQHQHYVRTIETILGPQHVIHCPATNDFPDSCFVEDTMVAIGNRVVITRLGHESRRGEVDSLQLPKSLDIIDMRRDTIYPDALCDGGDVLFTGRHLFVGLSNRTNRNGMQVLREAFPEYETVAVPVLGALHLKSVVTHMDENTLVAWADARANKLLDDMQATNRGYEILRIPDALAANALLINQHLLVQDVTCQQSRSILQKAADARSLQTHVVDTSELAKCDGALTCCTVLLTQET